MSESTLFEVKNEFFAKVREALAESVKCEIPSPTMFSSLPVVGMMRIRREFKISHKLQQVVEAVLRGDKSIRLDGIRLEVPTRRRHDFEPVLPVFISVAGIEIDVSIRALELIHDHETAQPAVLIQTASALRPDLVMVLSVLPERIPKPESQIEDLGLWLNSRQDILFSSLKVPSQYQEQIRKSTRYAWQNGITTAVMRNVSRNSNGRSSRRELEQVARDIVKQLADAGVVSVGWFFWARLGYWLLKIIMMLLEEEQDRQTRSVVVSSFGKRGA